MNNEMRKEKITPDAFELKRTSIGLEISLRSNAEILLNQNDILFSDEFFFLDSKILSILIETLTSKNKETCLGSACSKKIFIPQATPKTISISRSDNHAACFNFGELSRMHLLRFLPSYPFKEHQEIGVNWLRNRKSVILADDMGLGKTLQAIAALDHHIRDNRVQCALVICPKSLIGVWDAELKLWAPHLCVVVVYSTISETRWAMVGRQCHVAITNFESIISNNINPKTFDLVIYDEIHKLKNSRSNAYNSAYKLKPKIAWGLSGTPLENRSIELASILHLIDRNRVALSDGKLSSASLRSLASKYILRRSKNVISNELPNIMEKIEYVPLSEVQRNAYNAIIRKCDKTKLNQWIKVFNQLREICDFDSETNQSTKVDRATELVKAILKLGEKVVIFSYLTHPLSLLHAVLTKELMNTDSMATLTGSTSANYRISTVKSFQDNLEPSVLLCTTRAMAEGVTLTSANHVIFLNEWWNPAVNSQARDRVYRIGQQKDVFVYKIRTINSLLKNSFAPSRFGKIGFSFFPDQEFAMRGVDTRPEQLFSYVNLEDRIPESHPLRAIRKLTDDALGALSGDFDELYSRAGRPGIAPEKLLRALLLQAFFSIRSERQLMEQLDYNLLFRWFVGLDVDDAVWDATVFTKNRDRLLRGAVAARFLAELVRLPEVKGLLSEEHFSVDGTRIAAWASVKSFRPKGAGGKNGGGGGNDAGGGRGGARDFRGERWSNETHESTTDKDARLYRKGRKLEAKLSYLGHALMENRSGLVVDGLATRATGTAERDAAEVMLMRRADVGRKMTLGADKGYDAKEFVTTCKAFNVEPHVARNTSNRRSNVPDEVAETDEYKASQVVRKRVEEVFGWVKTVGVMAKTRHRGLEKVGWQFTLALAAYNLARMPKLLAPRV